MNEEPRYESAEEDEEGEPDDWLERDIRSAEEVPLIDQERQRELLRLVMELINGYHLNPEFSENALNLLVHIEQAPADGLRGKTQMKMQKRMLQTLLDNQSLNENACEQLCRQTQQSERLADNTIDDLRVIYMQFLEHFKIRGWLILNEPRHREDDEEDLA